jgi:hypothetical protein
MRNTLIAVALLSAASAHADQSVLTYHGALDRAGRYVVPGLTYERARGLRLDASFHAAFQGKVYAQPLLWRRPGSSEGELIVVTEDNEVFALDAQSGKQIWKRALGSPVQRSALPCGNISPLGVTGAPVIDEQRATLYLDAAVMRGSGPRQEIFALSLADGSIEPGWPLDVATALGASFDPSVQNQRGALALFKGQDLRSIQRALGRLRRLSRLRCRRFHRRTGQGHELLDARAWRRHMGAGRWCR